MRVVLSVLVVAACLLPAIASEPGEPLDCSDWVFLEPGYHCVPWVAYPCPTGGSSGPCAIGPRDNRVFDNQGRLYDIVPVGVFHSDCPPTSPTVTRIQLVRFDGPKVAIVGYVQERCYDGDKRDVITSDGPDGSQRIMFDPSTGRMLTSLSVQNFPEELYATGFWVAAIDGFATTFEILQSYEPTANTIGYRVPYMPEGFQYADHFDTYYGPLTNPIDFGKAQPLECGYPATAPSVGDYLTVNDPLPDPPVNTGRYYVTAVNHIGQRRYGRQNSYGVLSGRDPGLLPGCE